MAIKPISQAGLDAFGIDPETRRLYWHGKEVVTTTSLPRWVQWSAIIAAGATVVQAVAAVAQFAAGH